MFIKRIITSVFGLAVFAAAVAGGIISTAVLTFVLVTAGMYEFIRALTQRGHRPVGAVAYACAIIIPLMVLDYPNTDRYLILVLAAGFFAASVTVILCEGFDITDVSVTVLGIMYIAVMFSYMLRIRMGDSGHLLLWAVILGAWGTDTFAYFTGRFFGRRRIIPGVSPAKTVEGSIGGIAGAVAVLVIFSITVGENVLTPAEAVGAGLLAGIVSQLGDWLASAIKRYAGLKDFGRLLPGHGGILDRFDSILFTAPVLFYFFSLTVG